MLSVCIPVYNFNVSDTILELSKQLVASGLPFEILVFDDASEILYKEVNRKVSKVGGVYYDEMPENIGRSRIRNLLAEKAKFDYLLFLDCDSLIHNKHFIASYIDAMQLGYRVICGGRIYNSTKADKNHLLRWKYGKMAESKPAIIRSQNPSRSFMTNSFIIKKSVFNTLRFNEQLSQYGHEDTLFGYDLSKNGIIPLHIENPVLNGDVEENKLFLEKTRQGLENLAIIYRMLKSDKSLIQQVSLLAFYERVCCRRMLPGLFPLVSLILKLGLFLGIVNLKLFNFYKLCYFARQLQNK